MKQVLQTNVAQRGEKRRVSDLEGNDARKRLSFKTDLEMWHKFVGFAGWLLLVAKSEEHKIQSRCLSYSYDSDAFESYCGCKQIDREIKDGPMKGIMKDFEPDEECWKCPFMLVKGKEKSIGKD